MGAKFQVLERLSGWQRNPWTSERHHFRRSLNSCSLSHDPQSTQESGKKYVCVPFCPFHCLQTQRRPTSIASPHFPHLRGFSFRSCCWASQERVQDLKLEEPDQPLTGSLIMIVLGLTRMGQLVMRKWPLCLSSLFSSTLVIMSMIQIIIGVNFLELCSTGYCPSHSPGCMFPPHTMDGSWLVLPHLLCYLLPKMKFHQGREQPTGEMIRHNFQMPSLWCTFMGAICYTSSQPRLYLWVASWRYPQGIVSKPKFSQRGSRMLKNLADDEAQGNV